MAAFRCALGRYRALDQISAVAAEASAKEQAEQELELARALEVLESEGGSLRDPAWSPETGCPSTEDSLVEKASEPEAEPNG